jgi:hypothetical protein
LQAFLFGNAKEKRKIIWKLLQVFSNQGEKYVLKEISSSAPVHTGPLKKKQKITLTKHV